MAVSGLAKAILLLMMMMMVAVKLKYVRGSKILLVGPQLSSHMMFQLSIGEELVQRGHEVYVAIGSRHHNLESLEQKGFHTLKYHIPVDVLFGMSDDMNKFLAEQIFRPGYEPWDIAVNVSAMINRDCEYMLSDKKFLEQVQEHKLDIFLVEPFILNPCNLLFPHYLNIRFISVTSYYAPWIIRLPALPSFFRLAGPYGTIDKEPTLWHSVASTMIYVGFHSAIMGLWNKTFLHHYSSDDVTWNELILKSELFLMDNDHHLGSPLPLFPNVIPVSGFTIRPAKPLPDELEKVIKNSQNGIILVTFGATASYFPESVIDKFLQTFSNLKQTVIARVDKPEGVQVPDNVHISQWLPQNDILGHQQTKLFITHCGSNSQHEALYHGVPMLGIPLFAEQHSNCDRAVDKGFGLQINIHNFTSAEMLENIQELLRNKTYSDNVKRGSAILRDEPLIGPNKAVHWIEHVIKYGSSHLRPAAADLPVYRFFMLDVLAIFFITTFVIASVTFACAILTANAIWKKLTNRKPSQKKLQ